MDQLTVRRTIASADTPVHKERRVTRDKILPAPNFNTLAPQANGISSTQNNTASQFELIISSNNGVGYRFTASKWETDHWISDIEKAKGISSNNNVAHANAHCPSSPQPIHHHSVPAAVEPSPASPGTSPSTSQMLPMSAFIASDHASAGAAAVLSSSPSSSENISSSPSRRRSGTKALEPAFEKNANDSAEVKELKLKLQEAERKLRVAELKIKDLTQENAVLKQQLQKEKDVNVKTLIKKFHS